MGVLSHRVYRPCVDSSTFCFGEVRAGNSSQIQVRTPTTIIQVTGLDHVFSLVVYLM